MKVRRTACVMLSRTDGSGRSGRCLERTISITFKVPVISYLLRALHEIHAGHLNIAWFTVSVCALLPIRFSGILRVYAKTAKSEKYRLSQSCLKHPFSFSKWTCSIGGSRLWHLWSNAHSFCFCSAATKITRTFFQRLGIYRFSLCYCFKPQKSLARNVGVVSWSEQIVMANRSVSWVEQALYTWARQPFEGLALR